MGLLQLRLIDSADDSPQLSTRSSKDGRRHPAAGRKTDESGPALAVLESEETAGSRGSVNTEGAVTDGGLVAPGLRRAARKGEGAKRKAAIRAKNREQGLRDILLTLSEDSIRELDELVAHSCCTSRSEMLAKLIADTARLCRTFTAKGNQMSG